MLLPQLRRAYRVASSTGIGGEILPRGHEILTYYSHVAPQIAIFGKLLPKWLLKRPYDRLATRLQKLEKDGVTVACVLPKIADGGMFVKYAVGPTSTTDKVWPLIKNSTSRSGKVFKVLGTPWIDDIPRMPSSCLRVDSGNASIDAEELYRILRPYGQIRDIEGSKVEFRRPRDAAAARSCVYGVKIGNSKLRLIDIPDTRHSRVWSWIISHPRFIIPVLLAFLFTTVFLIFEPIRRLCVTARMKGTLEPANYAWIRSFLPSAKRIVIPSAQVEEGVEQLTRFLKEGTPTFVVVTGPRGSGKSKLVNESLHGEPVLRLDAELLESAKTDAEMLARLASMLNYRPSFLWLKGLTQFVDLGIQSLTAGQVNASVSETTDEQARRMLATAAAAIKSVAVSNKSAETREMDYLAQYPEAKPVVIITHYGRGPSSHLLAEWAAGLTQSNLARTVFVTNDVSYDKTLAELLPDRLFKTVTVDDAPIDTAADYVHSITGLNVDNSFLLPFGGRLSDLQLFSRRLLVGEPPEKALQELIHQVSLEISQRYLFHTSIGPDGEEWSPEQAWSILRKLASQKSDSEWIAVPGQLPKLVTPSALEHLESREMIMGRTSGGRLTAVKSGSPLYWHAFRKLTQDPVISSIMDYKVLQLSISKAQATVREYENELRILAELPRRYETTSRQDYLAKKLYDQQTLINEWEAQNSKLESTLAKCDVGNEAST